MRTVVRDGFRLIGRFVRARPWSFGLAVAGAVMFAAAIVAAAVVAIVGVAVWKAAAITQRRTAATWLQYRTQADVRYQLVAHQLGLDLAWFSRQSTGDLLAVSETDARQGTFILAPLPFGTGSVLLLLGTVAIISWIDWPLGIITVTALAGIVVVDIIGAWQTFEAFSLVQHNRGVVSSVAHESFDGALTVKALGREEYETRRLEAASQRLRDAIIRVNRIWALFRAIVESAPAVTTVILLVVGALRIDAGRLTPGELVTVAYLLSLLAVPVRLVGFVLWDLAHSLAGWRRVENVLRADDFVRHGTLQPRTDSSGAAVEGSRVAFGYEEGETVLSDLEVDIPAGRTVAVVGPTGSGKSTLAMLLARLWDPGTGRLHLDGRDLRDFARSALPREVAFVAQEAFLFDGDVTDNITLGLPIDPEEVQEAARMAAAHDFVAELPDGYATRIGERGTTLSGGQRQRIALARALVRRPRLLLLDDATSAVDPSVETEILKGLKRAELPSTVVIVAHRRSSIVLADEVVYLENGTIVDHGGHAEVLARTPGYARLLQAYEEDAEARRSEAAGAEDLR